MAPAAEPRDELARRFEGIERRLEAITQQQEQLLRQSRGQAERLEQRFNQMAERREQFMRQAGRAGPGPKMQAPRQNVQPGPGPRMEAPRQDIQPGPAPQPPVRPPFPPEGFPPAAKFVKSLSNALGLAFVCWILCNILLAIWIFGDIRKRGQGPAVFVALALIAGIPAAVIYALVRLGDGQAATATGAATKAAGPADAVVT